MGGAVDAKWFTPDQQDSRSFATIPADPVVRSAACFCASSLVLWGKLYLPEVPSLDHFDWLAPLYDRVIQAPGDDTLMRLLDLPVKGWLLDAGGGTGRIAQRLQDQVEKIVIADGSMPMLRQASGKNCCSMVASTTECLPFMTGTFERVIVVDAYHHLTDQNASLQAFWRVLAPGGLLVIEEPDIERFGVKLLALVEKLTFFRSHFVRAEHIAGVLLDLGAQTEIHRSGNTVWVIANKL